MHRIPTLARLGLGVTGLCLVAGTFGPGPNSTTIPSTGQSASIAITAPADGTVVVVPAAGPASVPINVQGNVSLGAVAGNPINVVTVVDTSGSTSFSNVDNQDCNGDGVVNNEDEFNNSFRFADTLDCEISGVIALNESLFGFTNVEVGLVEFESYAYRVDVNPVMPGDQAFTSPAELDLDTNGVPDVEQAARSLTSGGGTNFRNALAEMNASFATQPAGETNVGFFLSDGVDGSFLNAFSPELVAAVNAGTIVNTFSVGPGATGCTTGALALIASETGGTCTVVSDPADLATALPGVAPALLNRVEVDGLTVSVDALGNFMTDVECPSDDTVFTVTAEAFFDDTDSTTVAADVDIICEPDCPFTTSHPASLGAAGDFNVVVFDDYTGGLDIEGGVAVGGNASFTGFSIGAGLAGGDALVVGGDLSLTSGTVGGDAFYGGTGTAASDVTFANGGSFQSGTPIDFVALAAELGDLSMDLATLFPTSVTQVAGDGGLTLAGTDADLNVFTVSESEIEGATSLRIDAPSTSTVLVNVAGADLDFGNFQWTLVGVSANQVLVNLYEATSADLSSVPVKGSLLAPIADMTFSAGDLSGTLVAKSLSGTVEVYDHPYTGVVAECPEEPAPAVADCEADYQIVNAWPSGSGIGYQVQVDFSHGGAPLNDWQLSWSYPGADSVQNLWNGSLTQLGSDVTVTSLSWNGSVSVGQNVSFGFIGWSPSTYPSLPAAIELNGVTCE